MFLANWFSIVLYDPSGNSGARVGTQQRPLTSRKPALRIWWRKPASIFFWALPWRFSGLYLCFFYLRELRHTPAIFHSVHCPFMSNLRLVPGGIFFGAPPCSLFVGASASLHMRSIFQPWGDTAAFSVRLSNRIWRNMVPRMHALWPLHAVKNHISNWHV